MQAVLAEDVRPRLTEDALNYALGSYSGPTNPPHRNVTFAGLTHPKYNKLVREQLVEFLDARGITLMTVDEMAEFVDLIKSGRNARGQHDKRIADFNDAIRKAVPEGTKVPSTKEEILDAGRKYSKNPRFRGTLLVAIVSGMMADAIVDEVDLLNIAANSRYYNDALNALEKGDLAKARTLLCGQEKSLYQEIVYQAGADAGLRYLSAMRKAIEVARSRANRGR